MINQIQPGVFFVPYSGYSSIIWNELAASSGYNALQVNYRHTAGHGLTFQGAYTWSHAIDNASTPGQDLGVDFSNESRWYSSSDFNRTHVFVANYIYDLPFFKNATNHFL